MLNQGTKQVSEAILLALFVVYFVSTNFFGHKHLVNGVLIVHSHPFSQTEQHNHSCETINLLQQLSHVVYKFVSLILILSAFIHLLFVFSERVFAHCVLSIHTQQLFSRPPPLLACFFKPHSLF